MFLVLLIPGSGAVDSVYLSSVSHYMRNQHLTITAVFSVCKDDCLHSPAEISPYLSAAGQRSRRAARVCCGLIGSSVCVLFSSTLTLKPSLLNFTAWTHQERVLSAKSTRAFLTGLYCVLNQTVYFRHVWKDWTNMTCDISFRRCQNSTLLILLTLVLLYAVCTHNGIHVHTFTQNWNKNAK